MKAILKRCIPARWVLRQLLRLDSWLYRTISRVAVWYGNGLHRKHRLTGYHDFFVRNIRAGERVLDIGCGNGVMDYQIAKATRAWVRGVDRDHSAIAYARHNYRDERLTFVEGEALDGLGEDGFDVVILSNVLEHIERRGDFLRSIGERARPARVLIRVPLFERDWRVPLKGELGVNYLLDPTHFVEHTREGWGPQTPARRGPHGGSPPSGASCGPSVCQLCRAQALGERKSCEAHNRGRVRLSRDI